MATLEDLNNPTITEMSQDEAVDLLRQIRLSRRIPTKKPTKSIVKKLKAKAVPKVSADDAVELLKLLGG